MLGLVPITFDAPVMAYGAPASLVQTTAVSEVARRFQDLIAGLRSNEQTQSLAGRAVQFEARLRAALDELVIDEDQRAVPTAAVRLVSRLVRGLPASLPLPDVSIDPDGAISLDWMPSRTRLFSISVDDSDRLAYAWVNGSDRGHGVVRLSGPIPRPLLSQLMELMGDDTSVRAA